MYSAVCDAEQFICESEGNRCLSPSFLCDGIPDCVGEGSLVAVDETGCELGK